MTSKEALAQIAEYSEAGLTVRGTSSILSWFLMAFFVATKNKFSVEKTTVIGNF